MHSSFQKGRDAIASATSPGRKEGVVGVKGWGGSCMVASPPCQAALKGTHLSPVAIDESPIAMDIGGGGEVLVREHFAP